MLWQISQAPLLHRMRHLQRMVYLLPQYKNSHDPITFTIKD